MRNCAVTTGRGHDQAFKPDNASRKMTLPRNSVHVELKSACVAIEFDLDRITMVLCEGIAACLVYIKVSFYQDSRIHTYLPDAAVFATEPEFFFKSLPGGICGCFDDSSGPGVT
jgi:hypothetical protein